MNEVSVKGDELNNTDYRVLATVSDAGNDGITARNISNTIPEIKDAEAARYRLRKLPSHYTMARMVDEQYSIKTHYHVITDAGQAALDQALVESPAGVAMLDDLEEAEQRIDELESEVEELEEVIGYFNQVLGALFVEIEENGVAGLTKEDVQKRVQNA